MYKIDLVILMAIDYQMIGRRLQDSRKAQNLTQEVLAERVGITVVYLSKVENGRVRPTLELLDSMCDALGITLSSLLTGVQTQEDSYANERVVSLLRSCSPEVKGAALDILERLSQIG